MYGKPQRLILIFSLPTSISLILKIGYRKYHFKNNPLFVPEVRLGPENGAQALFTIGSFNALGFSPFSIESTADPAESSLTKAYDLLTQLSPVILKQQIDNKTYGVLVDKEKPQQEVVLENYILTVAHDYTLGWSPQAKEPGPVARKGAE